MAVIAHASVDGSREVRANRRPVPNLRTKKRQNTTAPGVPAWFLNVVPIWPNPAWLPRSDGTGYIQSGMTVACLVRICVKYNMVFRWESNTMSDLGWLVSGIWNEGLQQSIWQVLCYARFSPQSLPNAANPERYIFYNQSSMAWLMYKRQPQPTGCKTCTKAKRNHTHTPSPSPRWQWCHKGKKHKQASVMATNRWQGIYTYSREA